MVLIDGVKVGGINYKVEEKSTLGTIDGEECVGLCEYHGATISVLDSLSTERKEQTFVHELTHATFLEAGYDLGEQDEDMINRIGIVLHQVLKDNYVPRYSNVSVDVDTNEVAEKVAEKMLDAIDSDLGSDEEKEFWIDTDQAELVGCEVIDFEGVNGLEVLNATFSIRWKRDWQLPESNVEKLANCRFKLKCETAE